MRHLIVGYGEVGKALHKVLGRAFIQDVLFETWWGAPVDMVHICIPYSKDFKRTVKFYKRLKVPVIIHSTVPLGTSKGLKVTHSPIRGVHPNLAKGIKTFVKYVGGPDAKVAAKAFKDAGIKVKILKDSRTCEALKLWDTTQYGRLIMLQKEIYAWCKKNKVPFEEVYTEANRDYNAGYVSLGRPEVVRPYLKNVPGPIGGHCVQPNAKLLGKNL